MASAARVIEAEVGASAGAGAGTLYRRIGDFLVEQRLAPDPVNYGFAYAVLSDPHGPLAKAVDRLTDGGVRLTVREIEALGHTVSALSNPVERAEALMASTQFQVEGFADMVEDLRAETRGFGRDLAASADRIRQAPDSQSGAEIARIASGMVARVQAAEEQLERATREADELRAMLDEARDNARRDPLTGLANRRAFEEAFAAAAARGDTMWLAVCDVDHFKSVNDRFGHSVGDRVLKAIGTAITESCDTHFVARYGGEEFVVLFTGIDGARARGTLEDARIAVAAKRYRLRETDEPLGAVTFSAGLVAVTEQDSDRSAFGRADKLLYAAKNDGRNCVHVG